MPGPGGGGHGGGGSRGGGFGGPRGGGFGGPHGGGFGGPHGGFGGPPPRRPRRGYYGRGGCLGPFMFMIAVAVFFAFAIIML